LDGFVSWPDEIDLAPDAMYDEIKQHGEWQPAWADKLPTLQLAKVSRLKWIPKINKPTANEWAFPEPKTVNYSSQALPGD